MVEVGKRWKRAGAGDGGERAMSGMRSARDGGLRDPRLHRATAAPRVVQRHGGGGTGDRNG